MKRSLLEANSNGAKRGQEFDHHRKSWANSASTEVVATPATVNTTATATATATIQNKNSFSIIGLCDPEPKIGFKETDNRNEKRYLNKSNQLAKDKLA